MLSSRKNVLTLKKGKLLKTSKHFIRIIISEQLLIVQKYKQCPDTEMI